jgi:hypothetical protein
MANTSVQLKAEDWVRIEWMRAKFGQQFRRERLKLTSGGVFDFDAVSADGTIAATISTSGGYTARGKLASAKLHKLRADILFLLMSSVPTPLMILTEKDMLDVCLREKESGRMPPEITFHLAELPPELAAELATARKAASDEVSPR